MPTATSGLHTKWCWRKRLLALALALPLLTACVGAVGVIAPGNAYADKGSAAQPSCQTLAANAADSSRCNAKTGDLPTVTLAELHPTQAALGYDAVRYRLGRYHAAISKDRINQRFNDWCQANGQGDAASAQPHASCKTQRASLASYPWGKKPAPALQT